jgi:hypothetical protein
MKLTILLPILLLSINLFAQDNTGQNMKVETTREATYPDGDNALYTYLFKNIKYTEEAKANKAQGDIMVSFIVETDSSITSMKVISDVGYGCGDGLKEVLGKMKYIPALVNGVPMRSKVIITVPVRAH